MNVAIFIIGVVFLTVGVFLMTRHKFYKYKTSDMLFGTSLRAFLGAALIALIGILAVINELKKLL